MITMKVDVKQLRRLEENMVEIEPRLRKDVERVQLSLAEKAVHTAKTVLKPDINYGSRYGRDYRTGLLNRSYRIAKGTSGRNIRYNIHNYAPYFDDMEHRGRGDTELVTGFFHPRWKTQSGNPMFIHTRKGQIWVMPVRPQKPFHMMTKTIGSKEYQREYTRLLEPIMNAIATDMLKVK